MPHGAVGECQRDDVRPHIVEYVPAVSATTNTLPGPQRSFQHAVPMWPATLYIMRLVHRSRPIWPIFTMPPWWRRARCSVVLRTIKCKAHSDGTSINVLAVFVFSACFSRNPGPEGTIFRVIYSRTWKAYFFSFFFVQVTNPTYCNPAILPVVTKDLTIQRFLLRTLEENT